MAGNDIGLQASCYNPESAPVFGNVFNISSYEANMLLMGLTLNHKSTILVTDTHVFVST